MKINKNSLLAGVSGRMGDFVLRQVRGRTIIAKRPTHRGRCTEKQLAIQNRFRDASAYATAALMNPALKARYEQGITNKLFSARQVAMSDYLKAPVIHDIDVSKYKGAAGDTITITAEDDFVVKRVKVTFLSEGAVVETGEAVQDSVDEWLWRYNTAAALPLGGVTIRISAFDIAGNKTTKEKSI